MTYRTISGWEVWVRSKFPGSALDVVQCAQDGGVLVVRSPATGERFVVGGERPDHGRWHVSDGRVRTSEEFVAFLQGCQVLHIGARSTVWLLEDAEGRRLTARLVGT